MSLSAAPCGPFAIDDERCGLDDQVHQHQVAHCRLAGFAMVHGKGAEHAAAVGEDRDRPAGLEPMREREFLVIRPQRIVGDV